MAWEVEVTDEFLEWYWDLPEEVSYRIGRSVLLLQKRGPHLTFPHTSKVIQSRHANMRELRVQSGGRPYRILYAFDPRRTAILLLGGKKTGDDRWYDVNVPRADRLYEIYLDEIREEGLI